MQRSILRWLKFITLFLVILLLIIAISVTLLVTIVDPNRYKSVISDAIMQQTGAKLEIESITWGIFPSLGLVSHNLKLTTSPKKMPTQLLELSQGEITLQILPLFHGGIYADKVILDGLTLNLAADNKTLNNWSFNFPSTSRSSNNYQVTLSSLEIRNFTLKYTNLDTHKEFILPVKSFIANGDITYSTESNNVTFKQTKIDINDNLTGKFNFDYSNHQYSGSLDTKPFNLGLLIESLGLLKAKILSNENFSRVTLNGNFIGNHNSLSVPNARFNFGQSVANLSINIASFSPLKLNNYLQIESLEATDFIPFNGNKLLLKNIRMNGAIKEIHNNTIAASQLLQIANLKLSGYNLHSLALEIAHILNNPIRVIEISVAISQIKNSIRSITSKGNKNLAITSDLGSMSTNIYYDEQRLNLSNLSLNGPEIMVNGFINSKPNVKNSIDGKLNARFVADPDTLTGKVIYPIYIKNSARNIDWNSVSRQITINVGSSIGSAGKRVGAATGSTLKTIGKKIKGWF